MVNSPLLFAVMRSYSDNKILTSRNSLQEFAGHATAAQGLRVTSLEEGSKQRYPYFFGNMNFLVYVTMILLQTVYTFILSQLVIPQWINPLQPQDSDDVFSPAFLMRFGSQETRPIAENVILIILILAFPFLGIHIITIASSFVVRVRFLEIADLSTFIPQYLFDFLLIPTIIRPGDKNITDYTHRLPAIPLQMPGPATNSLVISVVCHPKREEAGTKLHLEKLKWGVVRRPAQNSQAAPPTILENQGLQNRGSERHGNEDASPHNDEPSLDTYQRATDSRAYPTNSERRFSVRRRPLPPTAPTRGIVDIPVVPEQGELPQVVETHPEQQQQEEQDGDNEDACGYGHCTFSADIEHVYQLQPGTLYTGIRLDADTTKWRMRGRHKGAGWIRNGASSVGSLWRWVSGRQTAQTHEDVKYSSVNT